MNANDLLKMKGIPRDIDLETDLDREERYMKQLEEFIKRKDLFTKEEKAAKLEKLKKTLDDFIEKY